MQSSYIEITPIALHQAPIVFFGAVITKCPNAIPSAKAFQEWVATTMMGIVQSKKDVTDIFLSNPSESELGSGATFSRTMVAEALALEMGRSFSFGMKTHAYFWEVNQR
jgi:hypothetical protein